MSSHHTQTANPPSRVLVTGGATRLGREVCLYFASQGWDVAVHYNRSAHLALELKEELAQKHPSIAVSLYKAELSSEAQVSHLFEEVVQSKDASLECIVNNASLFEPDSGLDFTTELALEQLKVNLLAPMKLGQSLAQFHRNRTHGSSEGKVMIPSIVHVLDQKVFNLNPDYFSYTLSKLALERAVSLQAQSLAPTLRVNAVSPGLMYLSGEQTPENFAKASQVNLLQKAIDPKDVAKSCFFLASTPSLCGTTIKVDCGQHLVPLARDVMFMVDEMFGHNTPEA
jgi:NAD(P)-dependent dehydrogenase (short-subunit alcohol dehydrogenase family)